MKKVNIHASNSDTKCATVAVAMNANGNKFPPLIVFKWAPNGRIPRNDLLHMDRGAFYLYQKMHGWMRQ